MRSWLFFYLTFFYCAQFPTFSRAGIDGIHRRFAFTVNGDTSYFEGEGTLVLREMQDRFRGLVKYLYAQYEEGDKTRRPHIQGYCEFFKGYKTRPGRLNGRQELLGVGCPNWLKHLRLCYIVMRGSVRDNHKYCTKQKGMPFIQIGALPLRGNQGKRNDLASVREMVLEGKTTREIIESDAGVKFQCLKSIPIYQKHLLSPSCLPHNIKVIYIHGPSMSGKTSSVMTAIQNFHGGHFYRKDNTKWWDRYDMHEVVLLDDFSPGWFKGCPTDFLLALLWRYEFLVEVKGGYTICSPRVIFMTSNYTPQQIAVEYFDTERQQTAFLNRITATHEGTLGNYP